MINGGEVQTSLPLFYRSLENNNFFTFVINVLICSKSAEFAKNVQKMGNPVFIPQNRMFGHFPQ